MRHAIVRAAVLASVLYGATLAFAFSSGPPASRTGAPAVAGKTAEPNCSVCHSGAAVNDPAGYVRLLDVPTSYTPGQTYDLRVQLFYEWNPVPPNPLRWGFELQAVSAVTGDSLGAWDLSLNTGPDSVRIVRGLSTSVWRNRRYLEHVSVSTRDGQTGPVEWPVRWVAPDGDSGTVYFFLAGNAANGDGVSIGSGDHIFTFADTVESGTVSVPRPPPFALRNALEQPYPNPMWACTDVTFTIERSGEVDLAVFDISGRRVATLEKGFHESGSYGSYWGGFRQDGTKAPNGVYFVRLMAPGLRQPISRKVTLAR
jgi:hypothetical protein